MIALLNALRAEMLKLRRTLALWLVIPAPLAVIMLFFLNYSRPAGANLIQGESAWLWMTQNALTLWGLIMFPLFIALETALLAGVDHNANGWKHLYALPIPRWSVPAAKLIVGTGLILLAMAWMVVCIFVAGVGINLLNPGVGFGEPFPLGGVLILVGGLTAAGLFMIAIHTWISLRWQSFIVSMAVGIVSVFAALVISQTPVWWVLPWALPVNVENLLYQSLAGPSPVPVQALAAIALSVVGYIAAGAAGTWHIAQRDVL